MKSIIKLYLIALAVVAIGCGGNDESNEAQERPMLEVIEDFRNLSINSGANDFVMESTFKDVYWKFRIVLPADASESNKRPLIVRMHGAAGTIDSDYHKYTECLTEPGFESLNPIILSVNSDGFIWNDIPNQNKILTLTDLVKTNLPVDQNKVVVTGYSDGGNGSWFFAQYYPEYFSAAIPVASSYNTQRPAVSAKINIPVYAIHGSEDQLFNVDITQNFVNATIDAGSDVEFVIAPGLEHFNPCDYVPYVKEAANWLETTVWK